MKLIYLLLLTPFFLFSQPNPESIGDKRTNKTIFLNAQVFADAENFIPSCTLVVEGDKILALGKNLNLEKWKGFARRDLSGKCIYPSFIDLFYPVATNDMKNPSKPRPQYASEKKGSHHWNQAIRPELQVYPFLNTEHIKLEELKKKGVSMCQVVPQDGIVRGAGALVSLNKSEQSNGLVMVQSESSMGLSFLKGSSVQEYPTSRMGAIALLRQFWEEAKFYNRQKPSEKNVSLEEFNRLTNKPMIFEVNTKNDVFRAEKISLEWEKPFWIKTTGEEYQFVHMLKSLKSKLIVPVQLPAVIDMDFLFAEELTEHQDLMHWQYAPYALAIYEQNKLEICLTSQGSKDEKAFFKHLRQFMKNGASHSYILKSLTSNPAKWLDVHEHYGSLAAGKKASFIVSNAPLWDSTFNLQEIWVDGKPNVYVSEVGLPTGKFEFKTSKDSVMAVLLIDEKSKKIHFNDNSTLELNTSGANYFTTLSKKSEKWELEFNFYHGSDSLKGYIIDSNKTKTQYFALLKSSKDSIKIFNEPIKKNDLPKLNQPFSAFGRQSIPTKQTYLIKNATIWALEENQELLENHDILIHEGKIAQIGKNLQPKGFKQLIELDGSGLHLTPGIIDEHSHIAINAGVNESGQSVTSEVRIGDVLNPDDINIYRQLAGGVTTAHILHGSANCIGGQSALIKLRWGKSADSLKFENNIPFIKFALGENVKQSNWGESYKLRYPQTRMGVEQIMIDAFTRAVEYRQAKQKALKEKKPLPMVDFKLEALVEIIEGKRLITCHSYVQSEINMLMKVAEKFGFRINTFTHVLEGYKIADKLKAHGAAASSFSDWWAFKAEVRDAIPHNATILQRMGVLTAINSDDPEAGRRLNQEAAKSIKYGGMSEVEALKLVTLNPAKILKIDSRVGSIKIGKDADLVLWSGNPSSVYAKVLKTWVDGTLYFDMDEHEKKLNEIDTERATITKAMKEAVKKGEKPERKLPSKIHHYHCDDLEE